MKKAVVLSGLAVIVLLSGCASHTVIYDPASQQTGLRQRGNVSAEEFRIVAKEAINNALTSPRFQSFLAAYKQEMQNPAAIPMMKLTKVKNDTDDPDLKIGELTDLLSEALFNSGVVDVTVAEGADLQTAIAASRNVALDPNFNQATTAQQGTLVAARIVLCPKVISSEVRDGRTRSVVRTFVLEMADVKTGALMWKYTKQLGFLKTRGTVGF